MEFTAARIAEILNGSVDGDPEVKVNTLSKIEEGTPGSLTFLANPKYTPYLYSTCASVVIIGRDFRPEKSLNEGVTLIRVEDPYKSFAILLDAYNKIKRDKRGIDANSSVSESAKIGKDVYIGAFAFVGEGAVVEDNAKIYPYSYIGDNVMIGSNTTIFSGVKIHSDCKVGADCTLHSGVVIGSDGFGFAPNSENNYQKVPQIGNVIIEDHVEIGSNTCIDRATLGSTIIRKGVKLDNLIQIAHNVEIGENTVIAAQTGIAGSAKIGKNCMIGGQVGIIGHISIADNVKIAAQSGIGSSILNDGEVVQGSPAFPIGDYKRSYVRFRSLPEIEGRLTTVEQELKKLNHKH
jgi:UDP-3-O-[3-hydroxymyristoyl] glucosamine N-acyltransferase